MVFDFPNVRFDPNLTASSSTTNTNTLREVSSFDRLFDPPSLMVEPFGAISVVPNSPGLESSTLSVHGQAKKQGRDLKATQHE